MIRNDVECSELVKTSSSSARESRDIFGHSPPSNTYNVDSALCNSTNCEFCFAGKLCQTMLRLNHCSAQRPRTLKNFQQPYTSLLTYAASSQHGTCTCSRLKSLFLTTCASRLPPVTAQHHRRTASTPAGTSSPALMRPRRPSMIITGGR